MNNEIWMPVKGYEGRYEVSNHGRVRSLRKSHLSLREEPKILVQSLSGGADADYPCVCLSKRGRRKTVRVHVLVAEAFLGARPDGFVVRHLDGNPTNNKLSNLAWGTPQENAYDRNVHGTTPMKLSDAEVLIIRQLKTMGKTGQAIAAMFDVDPTTVNTIARGKARTDVQGELSPVAVEALRLGMNPRTAKNKPVALPAESSRLNGPWVDPQTA